MFTAEHFIWIGLCFLFVAGLLFLSLKKSFTLRRAGLVMVVICLLSEGSKILSNMLPSEKGGMHLDPLCLPFHLCSLMLFGVFFVTFSGESRLRSCIINFLSVMGCMGSILAILIPTNGTDFADLAAYQCFVYHAGLLWFAIYLIKAGHAKLGRKGYVSNLVFLSSLVVIMLYVNGALSVYDTNFFYLTRPPMEGLPLLNLDQGWYAYFIRIVILGISMVTLFHLPFLIAERKHK